MDIYSFFESPDIVEHCKKLNHEFNSLEMAVIIAKSNRTLKEKHTAWKTIIAEYPDMSIHKTSHIKAQESLHKYIQASIDQDERMKEVFYATDTNIAYLYRIKYESDKWYSDFNNGVYTTFANVWESVCRNRDEIECNVTSIWVQKYNLNENDYIIETEINGDGEFLWFNHRGANTLNGLEYIFIHVPIPFVKGDLLEDSGGENAYGATLYVFDESPHQFSDYDKFVTGERGDGTDMIFYAFFLTKDGTLLRDSVGNFLSLKYYRGELQNQNRFLKYLSWHIRNKDNGVDWLLNVFSKFKAENDFKNVNMLFGGGDYISLDSELYQ